MKQLYLTAFIITAKKLEPIVKKEHKLIINLSLLTFVTVNAFDRERLHNPEYHSTCPDVKASVKVT